MSSVFCCYGNPEGFFLVWFGFVICFFCFCDWLVSWLVGVGVLIWLVDFFLFVCCFLTSVLFCFVLGQSSISFIIYIRFVSLQ